jgi:hypothetical protein
LHQAGGSDSKRHQQCRPAHPAPRKRAGHMWIVMMVMMPMVMVVAGMSVTGMIMVIM